MVDKIIATEKFKRGYRDLVIERKQRELDVLEEVFPKLKNMERFTQHRNHKLTDCDYWELHLSGDVLLIYKYEKNELILLEMTAIGTHKEMDRILKKNPKASQEIDTKAALHDLLNDEK